MGQCPGCAAKVARQARTCPSCGYPIARPFLGRPGFERVLNVIVLGVAALVVLALLARW